MDDRLGTLQPGKLADLVIVDGKPDQDIEDMKNVQIVIVGGRVVVRDGAVSSSRHKEEVPPLSNAEGTKRD